MASFQKDAFSTPFGRNVFLANTRFKTRPGGFTFDHTSIPAVTIDGFTGQKVLQPGVVLASITAGPNAGKVGPYQNAGAEEVQLVTPSGTISGGTYTLTVEGKTTAAIAFDANAATIQAALVTALVTNVTVTGGPLSSGVITLTFSDKPFGLDEVVSTVDVTNVTGSGHAAAVTTSVVGAVGATDGRSTLANIVGINNTFLPAQLMDRDVEVASIIEGTVVQTKCLMLNAAGVWIAVNDTVAAAMFAKKNMNILWT